MDKALDATDSASAQCSRAYTDAAKLILPAYNRATFGQQLQVQHDVRLSLGAAVESARERSARMLADAPPTVIEQDAKSVPAQLPAPG